MVKGRGWKDVSRGSARLIVGFVVGVRVIIVSL